MVAACLWRSSVQMLRVGGIEIELQKRDVTQDFLAPPQHLTSLLDSILVSRCCPSFVPPHKNSPTPRPAAISERVTCEFSGSTHPIDLPPCATRQAEARDFMLDGVVCVRVVGGGESCGLTSYTDARRSEEEGRAQCGPLRLGRVVEVGRGEGRARARARASWRRRASWERGRWEEGRWRRGRQDVASPQEWEHAEACCELFLPAPRAWPSPQALQRDPPQVEGVRREPLQEPQFLELYQRDLPHLAPLSGRCDRRARPRAAERGFWCRSGRPARGLLRWVPDPPQPPHECSPRMKEGRPRRRPERPGLRCWSPTSWWWQSGLYICRRRIEKMNDFVSDFVFLYILLPSL